MFPLSSRFRPLFAAIALAFSLFAALPASAQITVTFWSQEFGKNFPHAFFQVRGVPEAGGEPVDAYFGFTAKSISPAILFGNVAGRIDRPKPEYVARSNAHFSLVVSDDEYRALLSLVREWDEELGDATYNLNRRNCVHFAAEAMRRAGLEVVEEKGLMKKPRSFTQSIARLNAGEVVVIEQPAEVYLASLPPLKATPAPPAAPPMPSAAAAQLQQALAPAR